MWENLRIARYSFTCQAREEIELPLGPRRKGEGGIQEIGEEGSQGVLG